MARGRPTVSVLLVDKSALEWARRDARARASYLALRSAHSFAACHITALEVCFSSRDAKDYEMRLAGQRALEWLAVTDDATDRALEVQRLLAAHTGNGHRRPIPDLIIAATAEVHGAEVLHVDSDYELIARVTGQPMRRLFDPGNEKASGLPAGEVAGEDDAEHGPGGQDGDA
jgi:predicted nucleic acid-binding protein